MGHGKKPKKSFTLTLHFNTKEAIEQFQVWYHEGGEQDSKYYAQSWGKDWMHLIPPDNACPSCEYRHDEDEINSKFYNERLTRELMWKCGNCNHEYKLENPYMADGT